MTYTGKSYRHGDLGLFGVEEMPEGLKKSNVKVLMTGSGGNDHTFDQGIFYPYHDGQVIGYLLAEGTMLLHLDHGKKGKSILRRASIEDGIYQLKRQVEDTHDGMKAVVD